MRIFVLSLLIITASLATSQPPTPSGTKTRQEKQRVANNKQQSRQTEDQSPSMPAISGGQVVYADGHNAAREKEQESASNWWMTVFTGILAVAAILQFGAAVFQYCAVNKQAVYTRRGLRVSLKAARAAERAVSGTFNAERPWVYVSIRNGRSPTQFELWAQNVGRTPALLLGLNFVPHERRPVEEWSEKPEGFRHDPTTPFKEFLVEDEQFLLLDMKGTDGYCRGVVAYQDTMGGPTHYTWFCFLYNAPKCLWKMAGPAAYNAYN